MISCQQVIQLIEELAHKNLILEWDNCGLMIGDYSKRVSKIMLTLTITPESMNHAVEEGFDMIISHHPLFFRPIKSLRKDLPLGKMVYQAITNDIAVYSAHTSLDIAPGGVNDVLAKSLGLENVEVLLETTRENLKKLVVFVPRGHENAIRVALGDIGAGYIGNYSHCSFNIRGVGTFKPLEGTSPFIGKQGVLEEVEEVRIETIVSESLIKKAVKALLRVHPYEEVAYDIYPLDNPGEVRGLGRVGVIKHPKTLEDFSKTVKEVLKVPQLRVVGDLAAMVSKVAVCGGAGGDMLSAAAFVGADVLVTGDVKYHDAEEARALGLSVIDAGHFATENVVMPVLAEYIKEKVKTLNRDVEITVYDGKDPFVFI